MTAGVAAERRGRPVRSVLVALSIVLLLSSVPVEASLDAARRLLEAGEPERALETLNQLIDGDRKPTGALLLARSEARFMLGDPLGGRTDLERALELDADLRAGWLTLGALEISQQRYSAAVDAFERARSLDPSALDNALNLGAARLLTGDEAAAAELFEEYLSRAPDRLEALLMVAKNYAVARRPEAAIGYLEQAVALNERSRIALRTDPSFESMLDYPRFRRLLETDRYQPPAGHHRAFFRLPEEEYEVRDGRVLGALIDAMRKLGIGFDSRIEVTPTWSLVWGDLRVKVAVDTENDGSRIDLSASSERYTREAFESLSQRLYRGVLDELAPQLPL